MRAAFLYGTLRHAPLLKVVLGRLPGLRSATLRGYAPGVVAGAGSPVLRPAPHSAAGGLLTDALDPAEARRLAFYEGVFGYSARPAEVETDAGTAPAEVFLPDADVEIEDGWDFAAWLRRKGELAPLLAEEIMEESGDSSPGETARHLNALGARANSRLLARRPAPTGLRRTAGPDDIAVADKRSPYRRFFRVEEYDVAWRRFDGSMGPVVQRAAFVSSDSAVVLPYDAARDRVLVVEQFRIGPHARGDPQPWHLEPVAGRIDPGEAPEDAARREAWEETGLTIGALTPIARGYPSPGAKNEFLHIFLGQADLPDGAGGVGGLMEEAEDIRGHVLSFDRLMDLLATGEAATLPLILSAHWLARHRDRLRADG